MVAKFNQSSVPYGNGNRIKTYQDNEGNHVTVTPLVEYILLETGEMQAHQKYTFDFSIYESPIRPLSLYLATKSTLQETVKVDINNINGDEVQNVFYFDLNRYDIPYEFPPILLFPFSQIVLQPRFYVFNCYILCVPAGLIAHDKVFERVSDG